MIFSATSTVENVKMLAQFYLKLNFVTAANFVYTVFIKPHVNLNKIKSYNVSIQILTRYLGL